MPATLIKLTINNSIKEFRPENVDVIDLGYGSSEIKISTVAGSVLRFLTPSPADALTKLAQIEAAMVSGTGVVWITDENTAITTSTTTSSPTTSTTTCLPLTIDYTADTVADRLDFTVIGLLFTLATVKDPSSVVINPSTYVIYSVDADTFIYGIPFGSRYGNWTITLNGCDYIVNVSAATTTTTSSTTTTTTIEPTTSTTTV
jgi:hypothetical protein